MILAEFIGGRAFYWGVLLSVLGCVLPFFLTSARFRLAARIAVLAGVLVVVASAAPFPLWTYASFLGSIALITFGPAARQTVSRRIKGLLLVVIAFFSSGMVISELRYSRVPSIPYTANGSLYVFGDSLSIGADSPGRNWPDLLAEKAKLQVRNLSFGGAKVGTSIDSVYGLTEADKLVIVELGGNDLLGGTSISEYRASLDRMLTLLSRPGRCVIMLELPLPPFYNRFGRVQRELASTHAVLLVPKRVLADVICAPGATVDGLHLSNKGHAMLAGRLFEMFQPGQ